MDTMSMTPRPPPFHFLKIFRGTWIKINYLYNLKFKATLPVLEYAEFSISKWAPKSPRNPDCCKRLKYIGNGIKGVEGAVVKSFLSYFSTIFLLLCGFTSMYVIELRKFRELKYYQAKLLLIFSNYFVLYCHNAHNLAKKGQKLYSWGPNYIYMC